MKLIPKSLALATARKGLEMQAHSPKMLFVGGIVGAVGSTVLACRATLRLSDTLTEVQNNLNVANSIDMPEKYSDQDRKKDIALIYVRGTTDIVKLYGPAILLGVASITALSASNRILTERNLALTAAYAAVDEAYKKYRAKVVEKYGEEEDRKLQYDHEVVKVENDKGKIVSQLRVSPDAQSMYARFFDEYSTQWQKEPEYNLVFLTAQQNYWNDVLRTRNHVFLNEVYKSLGLDHTSAGSVVGWVLGNGDNFIDFGIHDANEQARDFVNGREGSILLDFNVDGTIFDKIGKDHRKGMAWQS